MSVLGKNWKYINEGNVHIVIGIQGENNGTHYVLRLIKEDVKTVKQNDVLLSADFVNFIMNPLVSNTSDDLQEVVEIPANELLELTTNLENFRPKERMMKSKLSGFAIKTSNLTIINPRTINYCVEIKLKEGFISPCFKKYGKCYYCLKQFLKLHEKEISNISRYCPLDLFSGNKTRMKSALFHLSESPQNNFKLFKNGQVIFCDSNKNDFHEIMKSVEYFKTTDIFFEFIIETLLHIGGRQTISQTSISDITIAEKSKLCDETNDLPEQTILYKILETQKLSKDLDISTAELEADSLDYVSSILEQLSSTTIPYIALNRKRFFESTKAIHLALISAVAKDCSIMISFSSNHDDNFNFIEVGEHKIAFKVSVTDLEPKLPKSLENRKKIDQRLIDIYKKYSGLESECPHSETRSKQLEAWQQLIAEYLKATKLSTIDIRESQNSPLFNNQAINRKLSQESILVVLEHMAKAGQAAPLDKSKNVWEVYWHSLDEWGNMVYNWACNNGMNNSVCTLFELREGENTVDEEFHGLDMAILVKALKSLEAKGKCELMEFDDSQGVKFF